MLYKKTSVEVLSDFWLEILWSFFHNNSMSIFLNSLEIPTRASLKLTPRITSAAALSISQRFDGRFVSERLVRLIVKFLRYCF